MKLFIYNGLKNNGRQAFQKLEITEEDANRWVQIDLEKRRQENGDDVAPRTPQEIVDEICKEAYDSDRRYRNIKADITTDHGLVEHNGDEESLEDKMERIPDNSYNPEEEYLKTEAEDEVKALVDELLSLVSEKQRKRLVDHYMNNKTMAEIAREEGVDPTTVRESILAAIKKIRKKI